MNVVTATISVLAAVASCGLLGAVSSEAFVSHHLPAATTTCHHTDSILTRCYMGLYDKPIPPRREPRDDGDSRKQPSDNDDDEDEDEDSMDGMMNPPLFRFDAVGREIRSRLPPLKRRLDTGIPCYFEPGDRRVINLVEKTGCHPSDACWALEAYRGDTTKAWTTISVIRRMKLDGSISLPDLDDDDEMVDWDAELRALRTDTDDDEEELIRPLGNDGIDERRKKIKAEQQRQNFKGLLDGGTKDENWMPGFKGGPIDDEPWFTG